jgi:hypothetical protein
MAITSRTKTPAAAASSRSRYSSRFRYCSAHAASRDRDDRKDPLISHNDPPMTDRAHDWAVANGYIPDARYPFRGPLPQGLRGVHRLWRRFNPTRWRSIHFSATNTTGLPAASTPICRSGDLPRRADDRAASGGSPGRRIEFGFYEVRPVPGAEAFLPGPMAVTQSHFHGFTLPDDATRLAESDLFPNQAFAMARRPGPAVPPRGPAGAVSPLAGRLSRPLRCQSRADQDAMIASGGPRGSSVRTSSCNAAGQPASRAAWTAAPSA